MSKTEGNMDAMEANDEANTEMISTVVADSIPAMEADISLESIIEAVLFASGKPMTPEQIAALFPPDEKPEVSEVKLALENIKEDYETRGIELQKVASGYRFQVRQAMMPWVSVLWEEKAPRYTRALLETLALIAYRQPITRGEIEDIRGVGVSSNIIRTLQEREWVRVVGRRDVPGRPAMYATTRQFLDYFNLANLNELPPLGEIRDLEAIAGKLEQGLQQELKGMSVIHKDKTTEEALSQNMADNTNTNGSYDNGHDGNVQSVDKEQSADKKQIVDKEKTVLVDHEAARAFKEETEKSDLEVFATVDELLSSVKTDFTDYVPEKSTDISSNESDIPVMCKISEDNMVATGNTFFPGSESSFKENEILGNTAKTSGTEVK